MAPTPAGCTVKDVPPAEFVTTYAAHLKRVGQVELPSWVDTIKTAPRKELAPYDQDWFYVRIGMLCSLPTILNLHSLLAEAISVVISSTSSI